MPSWLIAPAQSEAKLARVADLGAAVVVLDLTGDATPDMRALAREQARDFLVRHRGGEGGLQRWVRINALETPWWRDDLVAVLPGNLDGIVMSRAIDPQQVKALAAELYELEGRSGIEQGRVRILPQVGATAAAALAVADFASEVHPRMAGLAWDARDLSASLGARRLRGPDGGWSDPLRRLRADVLLAARARGLLAIETPYPRMRDEAGMAAAATAARGDGFTGMFAVHPAQVPVIQKAFAPTDAERERAREIVALFAGNTESNALPLGGVMVTRMDLAEARRLLG